MAALTAVSIYTLRFSYSSADMRGHVLGIAGAAMMLQTELTYTWRKKKSFTVGSTKRWLQLHIFTGLAGPALILWHAGFSFAGFAGLVTYLTILVTMSGVFGRYIYRSIPRTVLGEARTLDDLKTEQRQLESGLREIMADDPEALADILQLEILRPKGLGFIGLFWAGADYYSARRQILRQISRFGRQKFVAYKQLEETALKRLALERRLIVLDNSKRLLANWQKIHEPLSMTLFYAIGVHVAMALYYARMF